MYHSNINNNEKKELKCDHCDFKTIRKVSLLRHQRCVQDMYDKSFDDIDKTFDNLSDMEWQCKKCKKIFNTARAIEDHLISKDCTDMPFMPKIIQTETTLSST